MFEALSDRLSAALKKISGRGVLRPEDVDAGLREVRLALLEADVNFKVVKEFVDRVRNRLNGVEVAPGLTAPQQVVKAVDTELVEVLGGNSEGLRYAPAPPTVLMLIGLQGSGKTTTAVKLALLARREAHKPMVVALDLRRPAAVEQLRTLADREGVGFYSAQGAVEDITRSALTEASRLGQDVVILDTAGRLHIDAELMQELKRLKAAVPVTETLLVADAMTGQEAVKVGEEFAAQIGLDGVILTKLDGDARGGAALSLRLATGQQIRFAGTGERPQDLEVFHAERMASRILGMGDVLSLVERAERSIDQEAAQEVESHMRSGHLTFDDFLVQVRQLRKMGSLDGILDMVPGGAALKGQVAATDTEREVRRMEAVILSMTPRERAHPEIIDGARRRRIARGSGLQPVDVNRVLKARDTMQKLAKQLSLGDRGSKAGLGRLFGQGGSGWSR
ncbi:MAG: signal recognition particle protein [Actinobacteria bacterium 13_1_40CM_66_12]|nr:MAG: signal recognition particle protein [Actinobacteria bacterium 13_1_40CM_66_12]